MKLTINPQNRGNPISPMLYGVFFEDINYAEDGGLYPELIANRSFGFYDPEQRRNLHLLCWERVGAGTVLFDSYPVTVCSGKTYDFTEIILSGGAGAGLKNSGFCGEGFCLKQGERYRLRVLGENEHPVKLSVRITDKDGKCLIQQNLSLKQEASVMLTAPVDCERAYLTLILAEEGSVRLRYVSLYPADTFMGRENGLRRDLAERLKALKPRFLRFPGGCIVEGRSLPNMYKWKDTIGRPERRRCNWNRWQLEEYQQDERSSADYFQSYGLGFLEYFQLCEDLGASPVPVLNCGMACQWHEGTLVPMEHLHPWIQDALDLIEFANGDISTKWGGLRAELGHPEPFHLTMLSIGNEQWGKGYFERYAAFEQAILAQYPDMKLITCGGWDIEGADYNEIMDWVNTRQNRAYAVDEHFYKSPEWFLANVRRYDRYDRTLPKVFAGEYACHTAPEIPKRENNWYAALCEAAFLTGVEHNADHVVMACYAPLFAREGHQQWQPNLIWFDGKSSYVTPSYHIQQLFSTHTGKKALLLPEREVLEQQGIYAAASIDGDTVYLKLVNVSGEEASLSVDGWTCAEAISIHADREACNRLDAPERVTPVRVHPDMSRFTLPADTVLVITLKKS